MTKFKDIIGQRQVIGPLKIMIAAAKRENRALGHILLVGPPGLGKTTIARAIAGETGGKLVEVMAAKLDDRAAILNLLLGASDGDVIFIDEIHALRRETAESIYTAMQDFVVSLVIGEGERADVVRRQLARFTLVGATTEAGRILKPMRDRFSWVGELDYYSEDELALMLDHTNCSVEALYAIAGHSLGTPRRALKLMQNCRDFMLSIDAQVMTVNAVHGALRAFGVYPLGLSAVEISILRMLLAAGLGVPRGITAVAAQLNLAQNVIEETHEPTLLRLGLISRTGRGRMLTAAGAQYLQELT